MSKDIFFEMFQAPKSFEDRYPVSLELEDIIWNLNKT